MNNSGHAAQAITGRFDAGVCRGLAPKRLSFRPQRPSRSGSAARSRLAGLGVCLLFSLTMVVLGAGSVAAQERTHQVSWGHSNPNQVSRFVVLVSPVEGTVAATREINVGLPAAQAIGNMSLYSAVISFSADEYLAIAAVGHDGQVSVPSNWSGMPPTRPGQPLLVEP